MGSRVSMGSAALRDTCLVESHLPTTHRLLMVPKSLQKSNKFLSRPTMDSHVNKCSVGIWGRLEKPLNSSYSLLSAHKLPSSCTLNTAPGFSPMPA